MSLILLAQQVRVLENFGKLTYADQTTVHPIGAAALVICCLCVAGFPRRLAILPLLAMCALVPSAQRIVVLSLDFTFLRILIITALTRVIARGETAGFVWKRLDTLVVAWSLSLLCFVVLRTGGAEFVMQSGTTLDALGGYFVFRLLVRSWDDLARVARAAALLSIPIAAVFLIENQTQRNMFSVFGGVKEITAIRYERLRCMGPYNHPILAGCFWASLLPLIFARWWSSGWARTEAVAGSLACLTIVYCCASSTPVLGVLAGLLAASLFAVRRHMQIVRWGLLFAIVGLHLVMKAPVWHLISRISAVGGSTGWHRYILIDNFIRRFDEWWLTGTNSTAHWFWGGQDLTNHFLVQGVRGGFLTFALFIAGIVVAFAGVGAAWRMVARRPRELAIAWALGVSLFVHCACFFGVSYFGQTTMLWYMTLGLIGSLTPSAAMIRQRDRQRAAWTIQRSRLSIPTPMTSVSTNRHLAPHES